MMMLGQRQLGLLRRFLNTTSVIVEPRTSVDPEEIARFTLMANEWLDEDGPMKILHAFNRVRVPWIVDEMRKYRTQQFNEKQPLAGLKLLDVGSGSGILSFPLARLGAQVDGLEPSVSCVQVTDSIKDRLLTEDCRKRINFLASTVEQHSENNREAYDGIIVSEVVEHVADVPLFLKSCNEMLKRGSPIFFSTLNRTLLSRVVAVGLAEFLGFVPEGTHDWNKFLKPDELTSLLCDHHFHVTYTRGLIYDPLLNEWDWFASNLINYALLARKN